MKHKWKIKLIMSNGAVISGTYECDHVRSVEVGKELLCGDNNTFNAIACSNEAGPSQLFFRLGDVSAMEISPL